MPRANAGSRIALILRRLRARFGISAPQVAVRTDIAWYWRFALGAAISVLFIAGLWLAYDRGRTDATVRLVDRGLASVDMVAAHASQQEEIARLRGLLAASEGAVQIERAAQQALTGKNAELSEANARLREEIAVFERLVKPEGKGPAAAEKPPVPAISNIVLDKVSIRPEGTTGRYRYSFTVALQGAQRGKEARLSVQFEITLRGTTSGVKIVTLPEPGGASRSQHVFVVKNFRRVDGTFDLPAGSSAEEVDVRIFEAGIQKAGQLVRLP